MGMTEDLTNLVVVNLETGVKEKITVFQYDTARCIVFQFINGTEKFNLTGKTARIYMNKPDGELIFNDLETVSEEEGKASILLDENMLAVTGTMYCDITIYEGDKTISVPKFCISIMKPLRNDRSITSTAEYRALTDALANVDDFKTKVDNYNTYLEKLGTASPKGAFDSLNDLKAAYPLGDDSVYLVDVDGNYYVAIYENGEWESKFPYLTDELNFLVDDLNERFNNAINATTTDTEIIDARHDEVTQTTYTTLANRLKVVSTMLKGANTTKVPARWLGIEPKTDITEKLQYVLSDNNLKITIEFERDTWYKITNTIYIDTRKSRIDGNGCTFIGNMPDKSDCIFKITSSIPEYPDFYPIKSSSQNPAMHTALQPICNCFLMSEVLSTETNSNFTRKASGIGIDGYYDNGAKRKVSSINFENIAFYGLYKAIDYNSDCCYLNNFDKFTVSNCFYGVFMGTNGNDSGEKLGFSNGAFGSCSEEGSCIIFNSSKNYSVNFNNVSFDYNYKLIKAEYGTYYFNNCHFETNNELLQSDNDDFYWGELGATASILINNSRILLGSDAEKINKYVFNCKTTSDKSRQGNVVINNCVCNTYSEYWVNKGGIRVNNSLPMLTTVCVLPSPSVNIYADQYCRYDLNNLKSIHISIGANNVTDDQPTVITGSGYKFIHKAMGYTSEFLVKLSSGGIFKLGKLFTELTIPTMAGLAESTVTTLLTNCFTVSLVLIDKNNNIIKQTPVKQYGGALGSTITIEQNILTGFYEYDEDGNIIQNSGNQVSYNLFNPILSNCDVYLRVRTHYGCSGGSEFIMKNLKFIPCEV